MNIRPEVKKAVEGNVIVGERSLTVSADGIRALVAALNATAEDLAGKHAAEITLAIDMAVENGNSGKRAGLPRLSVIREAIG